MRPPSIDPLTSLRFFAAAAIVVHHLQGKFGVPMIGVNLGMGVSFFFVLSGFILTYVHHDIDDGAKSRRFYVARFARIWPLHAATLVAAVLFPPGYTARGVVPFIANALLLQAWWPTLAFSFSYNWPAWSISNEAFFYLLFPLVIIRQRQFAAIFLATAAFLLLILIVGGNLEPMPLPPTATNVPSWYVFVMTGPAARFFEFLFGMGLGLIYLKHHDFRMPVWAWTLVEISAIAAIVAYAVTLQRLLELATPTLGPVFGQWFRHNGGFMVFGLTIMCFAYRGGLLSRLLSLPFLVLLGEISFSTYMIHQIVIRFCDGRGWLATESGALGLAVVVTTIYVGSYLSWRFFERPAQRAILAAGRRAFASASA